MVQKQGAVQSRESGHKPPVKEQQAQDWKAGAEHLRFAARSPHRHARPVPYLQALQISEVRLRSPLLGTFPQRKEEKVLKAPFTRHCELHTSLGPDPLSPLYNWSYFLSCIAL